MANNLLALSNIGSFDPVSAMDKGIQGTNNALQMQANQINLQRQQRQQNALQDWLNAKTTPMKNTAWDEVIANSQDPIQAMLTNQQIQAQIAQQRANMNDAQVKQLELTVNAFNPALEAYENGDMETANQYYQQAYQQMGSLGLLEGDEPQQLTPQAYQELKVAQSMALGAKGVGDIQSQRLEQQSKIESIKESKLRQGKLDAEAIKLRRELKDNGVNVKDLKEFELTNAGYASRMNNASGIVNDLEGSGKDILSQTSNILSGVPLIGGALANVTMSKDQQKYNNAANEWIRAKLRKESGAVIGKDEMLQEYRTYFPVIGDTPDVIAQKNELRQQAELAMQKAAGRAYTEKKKVEADKKPETNLKSISTNELVNMLKALDGVAQ